MGILVDLSVFRSQAEASARALKPFELDMVSNSDFLNQGASALDIRSEQGLVRFHIKKALVGWKIQTLRLQKLQTGPKCLDAGMIWTYDGPSKAYGTTDAAMKAIRSHLSPKDQASLHMYFEGTRTPGRSSYPPTTLKL